MDSGRQPIEHAADHKMLASNDAVKPSAAQAWLAHQDQLPGSKVTELAGTAADRLLAPMPQPPAHQMRYPQLAGLRRRLIAGHTSPATTSRYGRRDGRTRRTAADRLSLPDMAELAL